MEWLGLEALRHLFATYHQKLLIGPEQRVERIDAGEKVVIGEDEKLIAALSIPPDDFVRGGVTVTIQRVRVGIAFEPSPLDWNLCRGRRGHP